MEGEERKRSERGGEVLSMGGRGAKESLSQIP